MRMCDDELLRIDYVNRELAPLRRVLFARHLARCPACSRDVEALAKISAAVRVMPRPTASPDVVERANAALVPMQPVTRSVPWWAGWFLESWERPSVVAAGAVAAGVLCTALSNLNGSLTSLLSKVSNVDVMVLLFGVPSRPEAMVSVPVGAILLIVALLSIPSLFDSTLGLLVHRAIVRSRAEGHESSTATP